MHIQWVGAGEVKYLQLQPRIDWYRQNFVGSDKRKIATICKIRDHSQYGSEKSHKFQIEDPKR